MFTVNILAALLVVGCGDDGAPPPADGGPTDAPAPPDASNDAGGPRDWPGAEPPASTLSADGVRRDLFIVPGTSPPPNPVTSAPTPSELDVTRVLRYREDEDPPLSARAIVIAYPGFLGGGASFDGLARSLVVRGRASGTTVEVWAIDRRANFLEDTRGLDTAEVAGDPEIAHGYYLGTDTIDGTPFAGYRPQADLSFESEWGLATHVEDLHRVIALVPEASRLGHVFLMGHSLGASFTEVYASWRFEDGTRGVEELAGLVLIDGRLSDVASTEAEYQDGTTGGIFPSPGLTGVRGGMPYVALPLLGVEVLVVAEIMALRELHSPSAVTSDATRNRVLAILLGLPATDVPAMTNRGAFGWGFDTQSNAFSFAAVSVGEPTGGPVQSYVSGIFGTMLDQPSDPDATYDWIDAPDADPPEPTPMDDLAHAWADGRTNFAEWYFPARLSLDIAAVAGTDVPDDDWQAREGLRAFDRELVDAPVLAIAAALVGAGGYATLASRLGPTVGPGRAHEGVTRADELGLRIVEVPTLSHLDPVVGADVAANPTAAEVEAFIEQHVAAGTVSIAAME